MKTSLAAEWKGNMEFDMEIGNHTLVIDAGKEAGGEDKGVRPKPLMLAALAGCTGMDVVSILQKMKVQLESFNLKVEGYATEAHPKHYYRMDVIYQFKGKELNYSKLEKAVNLSKEKYCGVSAAYQKCMELNYRIEIVD